MEQPDFANSTLREQLDALGREADSLELNFDCDRCRSFLQKLRELRIPRNTRSAHIIEFFGQPDSGLVETLRNFPHFPPALVSAVRLSYSDERPDHNWSAIAA